MSTAVESIVDQVDKIVILYSDSPSQGFGTNLPCPDTEDELLKAVEPWQDKIIWHKGSWSNEGDHTDAIRDFTQGYDWLVRFDSDEIYQPGSVDRLIAQAKQKDAHIYRVPFLHFWRNFHSVCRDGQMPDRITNIKGESDPFAYLDSENETNSVLHMGYAQPTKYIEYKMQVQGHRLEWRRDWFDTKWLPVAQTDVHPVVFDFWNVEQFDKTKLPETLKKHENYHKEVI